jgi:hypothetical protein
MRLDMGEYFELEMPVLSRVQLEGVWGNIV